MNVTTGSANEAVWGACFPSNSVTALGSGYTAGANDAQGDRAEYKLTSDASGTVETVNFTSTTTYNTIAVTIKPVPTPTITSLTPNSGAVGSSIVIAGTNFGATQGTSTVKFNGTTATATSWSASSITATVPAGATTGNVVVTVNGVASAGVTFTVVAAPSISSVTPNSGAVGSAIVIAGSNFGSTQGNGGVTFNGSAATISSWSGTSITATVPSGATAGNVVVTAAGGVGSAGVVFTVTPAPSISSLTPNSGAVGTSVVIAGSNFGSSQGNGGVTFNGTAATISSWSATSITATVPSGATTGNVVVTAAGGVASSGSAFTVTPAIISLSPTSGPVNLQVTVTGTSFGATQGTSVVNFHGSRLGGGNPIAPVISWSDTSIVVTVPNNAITGNVTVTVGSQVSNGVNFTILAPAISSLSPVSGAAGTTVNVTGSNFGPKQGTSTVFFSGGGNATVLSWSNTNIAAMVPAGATTGNVFVSGGTSDNSNGVNFTVPLALYTVSPNSGIAGTAVTLFGSSFGATQGASAITVNGATATVTSWSDTTIGATIPAGATSGAVQVTVGGQSSNGVAFTVPAPAITSLTNISGAVGTSITISGNYFGTSQGTSTVTFNGTPGVPTSWSNTSITVPVPIGASAGNIVVTVAGQSSNGMSFAPGPSIQSLSLTSASVGTPVTINGASFGTTQSGSTVAWNGTTATVVTWSDTSIVFLVPNVTTGSGNVVVTAGFASNSSPLTVVASDTISPSSGSLGTPVTITGTGFGATQAASAVTFNGVLATPSSWSNTSITVPVPGGLQPGAGTVVVTVGGVGTSVAFTVKPLINSLTPNVGVVGTSVVVAGASFGSSQGSSTLQFNGTTATPTSWSNTSITATVPTGVASSGNVVVTAANQPSNGVFFNIGPVVQSVSPTAGPVGTAVTINGINFGATQGTSTVFMNGLTLTPTSWSDTKITTTAPGGGTGNILVIARGLNSNTNVSFTIIPTITVSPSNAPLGTPITISGTNFGSTQGSSTVTFNGVVSTPTAWSNTSITAPVPNGMVAGPGTVTVTVGGVPNSTSFAVTPGITSLSPTSGVIGTSVVVTGSSFGATQGAAVVAFGQKVGTPTSWSDTSITVPVPTGASTGNVTVSSANGYTSNGVSFAVLTPPSISSIDNSSLAVGAVLGITGTHFGATQGSSTVTFNGTPATPSSWSDTQIGVPVPIGATTGNVVVTVNGLASNGVAFTPGPSITALSSNWAPIGLGPVPATITITGANFGATQGTSTLFWNGITVTPSSWSNSSIVLPITLLSTGTGNVVVFANGKNSNGVSLTLVPAITVSPSSAPLGTAVTITGTNFGATQGSSTVTFGGVAITPSAWSNTSISTIVPNGVPAGMQNLLVTVGTVVNSVSFGVTPAIKSLSPTSGVIGTSVTISGTSFGATQGAGTVTFNAHAATPTSWSDSQIVVPVPAGTTSGPVVVTAGSLSSNGVTFTVSGAPVISSASPGIGVIGTIVTIAGANFGSTQGTSTVTFNGTSATPISWSNTSITVPVPSGATTGNIVVTVASAPSNLQPFTVSTTGPNIQSSSPSAGPVGTTISLTGTGFGATQGTSFVQWNGFTMTPSSWSNTSITVSAPPAGDGPGFITVIVNGVASNGASFTLVPNITLSPIEGPVETTVTISGTNFGSTQGTSTVTFNGTTATPTSWSNTTIVVHVPAGMPTGNIKVVVTVGGVPNSGNFVVTPAITSLSPTSGPTGATVTITGTSFGSTRGTSTVDFGSLVATPITWSDTSITVPVPAAASSGIVNVVVTVADLPSNGVSFTVTFGITSVAPTSGPVGTVVTITGTDLGNTQGTSTVTFNGVVATPTSWSNTKIVVPVPAAATSGALVVTIGGAASSGNAFTVVPVISSATPISGSVGASVTIAGSGFGASQGTSTVTFNGAAATPTSWSATSIVVPIPAAATSGPIVVTVAGAPSSGFAYTVVPTITSVAPTSGAVGSSVTITGSGFGATQGTNTVTFNGVVTTPTTWSSTSIVVPVPSGATTGNIVVTVNGVASSGVSFTVAPAITSLVPNSGPVGTSVTITGTTFGATQGASTVTFNGTAATPTSWSSTQIVVPVPAGATTGNVVVTVNGVASSGAGFTVAPAITSLAPASGPVGTSVTITGTTFGATQGTSTVTFNGTAATPTSWNSTQIVVSVPSGATTGNVVVTVSGVASNGVNFTVTPGITSLSPTSGAAGNSVTITGTSFGATQGTSAVTFNGTLATPTSWGATSIVVPVPSGAHTGNVVVTVNGVASNGVNFTVTGVPSITGLSPISGGVGSTVTITGTGFGASQGTSAVFFNGTLATSITSWSDTSIAAVVPTGATSGQVTVVVGGNGSNGLLFQLLSPPILSRLSYNHGPAGMGLIVAGENLGLNQFGSRVEFRPNAIPLLPTQLPVLFWSLPPSPDALCTDLQCITVQIPFGTAPASGKIVATVNNVDTNGVAFTIDSTLSCPTPP